MTEGQTNRAVKEKGEQNDLRCLCTQATFHWRVEVPSDSSSFDNFFKVRSIPSTQVTIRFKNEAGLQTTRAAH